MHKKVVQNFILCGCTEKVFLKKFLKMFGNNKKIIYLCFRYPENNLFTLKELIPIECEAVNCEVHRFFYASSFAKYNKTGPFRDYFMIDIYQRTKKRQIIVQAVKDIFPKLFFIERLTVFHRKTKTENHCFHL